MKRLDVTGVKFGRLTALRLHSIDKGGKAKWVCECDCGNEGVFFLDNIKRGTTKSCGCLKKEVILKGANKKHGKSGTRLNNIWRSMKSRCNNPNYPEYRNYGGRGISVCKEWKQFEPFLQWALKNGYKDDLSIDRIENDKGYNPNNCRWVNMKIQNNNRRDNVKVTINNETNTLAEWARKEGINPATLWARYKNGDKGSRLIRPVRGMK